MKNTACNHFSYRSKSYIAGLLMICLLGVIPIAAQAQEEPIPGISDVAPSHWAYPALQELIQKYGLNIGFPDGKFYGTRPMTRYEIASLLLQTLKKLENQSHFLDRADQKRLERLQQEYAQELVDIKSKMEAMEDQVDRQEVLMDKALTQINQLENQFGFRVFGSLALRFCGMSTRIFQEPQNILANAKGSMLQVRIGGGIMGQMFDHFNYQVRVLTTANNAYNLSWFPNMEGDIALRSPIHFDRYFIAWEPPLGLPGADLQLTFGKALNFLPESQLLFDEDVSFTGFTQKLVLNDLTPWLPQISLGVVENFPYAENMFIRTGLLGAKLSTDLQPVPQLKVRIGGSYLHYLGTERLLQADLAQGFLSDTSLRNSFSQIPFQVGNAFAKVTYRLFDQLPISVIGDFVNNFGTSVGNLGFLAGLEIGELRFPGDISFAYNYKQLGQDYHISLFVQDQMGGTDVAGHEFELAFQLAQKTTLGFTLQTRSSLSRPEAEMLYIFYTGLRQNF